MLPQPKVQFNVYLPPELVKELKHRAIDEARTLSAVVESALALYLATTHPETLES